jgi:hypothetical protein
MFHIRIYFTVLIHHYEVIGSVCLLLCSHILVVNKHLEFILEMLVQACSQISLIGKIAGGLDCTGT